MSETANSALAPFWLRQSLRQRGTPDQGGSVRRRGHFDREAAEEPFLCGGVVRQSRTHRRFFYRRGNNHVHDHPKGQS